MLISGYGKRIVVSGYEHNAVMRALRLYGAQPIVAQFPPFDKEAAIKAYGRLLADGADGAVCIHISNVFGFELPIAQIAELCREHNVPLLIDAAQSAGTHVLDFAQLEADYIAMPGHKGLYGPQGVGILLCRGETEPIIAGGTGSNSASFDMPDFLPDRLEAGTMNIPGIAGLNAALDFVIGEGYGRILRHERALITLAADALSRIKGVTVYLPRDVVPESGVLSFRLDGLDSGAMSQRLADAGIAVRGGLHCAPLAHRSVGTIEQGTVRVSVSAFTPSDSVAALADSVNSIARKLR